jgi:hypothetical protein
MNKAFDKIFIIIYSIVNKKDDEDATLSVSIYISWNMSCLILMTLVIFNDFFDFKRDLKSYLIPTLFLIIIYYFISKHYFSKNKFIKLISCYEKINYDIKKNYKIISIVIFIIIQLGGMAAAQYAYLNK